MTPQRSSPPYPSIRRRLSSAPQIGDDGMPQDFSAPKTKEVST